MDFQFSSVQLLSHVLLLMDCSMPGFPVHHQLWELTQTHVHRVGDAIQPSLPLSSPSPPAFNLSQHQVFSNESVLRIRWPKYWNFSFSINPSNEYSGLIKIRIDWFSVFSNTTVQKHQFFSIQHCLCSNLYPYMTPRETIALTRQTFIGKVMSLLFNMLSRL